MTARYCQLLDAPNLRAHAGHVLDAGRYHKATIANTMPIYKELSAGQDLGKLMSLTFSFASGREGRTDTTGKQLHLL